MSGDCAFCAIIAGRARASVILDDGAAVAFLDLRQAVPGHVLVVPRRHVPNIYALQAAEAAAVMQAAVRVAQALRAQFDPPGLSLWQSNGEAAMQEIPQFICTCTRASMAMACCACIRMDCQRMPTLSHWMR